MSRRVVVTGASAGLGRACTEVLALPAVVAARVEAESGRAHGVAVGADTAAATTSVVRARWR